MSELTVREFIFCGKCGKKIARRLSDNSVQILFGRKRDLSDEKKEQIFEKGGYILKRNDRYALEIYIKGSLKIRCTSPYCDHSTIIL